MGFFVWVFCYVYLKFCYVCMGWDGRELSYRCIFYIEGFEFIVCMYILENMDVFSIMVKI